MAHFTFHPKLLIYLDSNCPHFNFGDGCLLPERSKYTSHDWITKPMPSFHDLLKWTKYFLSLNVLGTLNWYFQIEIHVAYTCKALTTGISDYSNSHKRTYGKKFFLVIRIMRRRVKLMELLVKWMCFRNWMEYFFVSRGIFFFAVWNF